ncbi:hypothetical protein KFE25_004419 [Diacronema lutheri]|uniref:Uncharacterized protein n=1 Tax=Diacronema lutheri TaxID=2081491 RepID=A0A8J6C6M0_DIALT|nr:hypothetical protein KFE25_004419 [Diacronema lutheri]
MGGTVSAWTDGKKGAFERAAARVLNAEVKITDIAAASVPAVSILVSFVAYARKGVYTDELSVAAKLRDATVVRRLKEALAQETGFEVVSDPRVTKTTAFAFSATGGLEGRTVFARTDAIVGGVLGGFFGVVLLTALLALVILRYRRRQAVFKSRSPTPAPKLQAAVVTTGRV